MKFTDEFEKDIWYYWFKFYNESGLNIENSAKQADDVLKEVQKRR